MVGRATPRLILMCGLPGSGKTTIARRLAITIPAVRLCGDEWMASLGFDPHDEPTRDRLEVLFWQLAQDLLRLGPSVILESGFWLRSDRDEKRLGAWRYNPASIGDFLTGLVCFILSSRLLHLIWTPLSLSFLLLVVVGGALIEAGLFLMVLSTTFWLTDVQFANGFLRAFNGYFALYPITLFNSALQTTLTFIVSVAFICYYPATTFLNRAGEIPFTLAFAYLTPLVGVTLLLWATVSGPLGCVTTRARDRREHGIVGSKSDVGLLDMQEVVMEPLAILQPSPLVGRVALITGVSRRMGIGFAVARRLAQMGADLLIHSWSPLDAVQPWGADPDGIDAVLAELRAAGRRVEHLAADFRDPDAPGLVVQAAQNAFGHVDILIANHAYSTRGALEDLTADAIDAHLEANVRGTLLLVKVWAAQHDDSRPGGRVILMTSGQHRAPMSGELAYVASKGALHQLTKSLASHLAPRGITVNTVNPGATDTGYATKEVYQAVLRNAPMGRWGEPDDAARLIAWLVTDDARWITGEVINSTGGGL